MTSVLVALALLSNLLTGGVIFGWVAMQSMLVDDGVYRSLCPEASPMCAARSNRFVLLFTIGTSVFQLGCFPCGLLVDWLGPVKINVLTGVVATAGPLMLGFSEGGEGLFDGVAAGVVLVGLGCSLVSLVSIPVGFVVPQQQKTLVITTIQGIFQSSPVTFLVLYNLYSAGFSRQAIMVSYAALSALVHAGLVVAWVWGQPSPLQQLLDAELQELQAGELQDAAQDQPDGDMAAVPKPVLDGLPLKQQLLTFEFGFLCAFFSIQTYRISAVFATITTMFDAYGDVDTGGTYAQIFGAAMFFSVFFVPLVDWCLKRLGFAGSFLATLALGASWNIVALVGMLPLQLLTIGLFVPFRVAVFAVHFLFLNHTFGSRSSASVQGVIGAFSAVTNLLVYPSVLAAESLPQFGYIYLYIALLLVSVPSAVASVILARRLRASSSLSGEGRKQCVQETELVHGEGKGSPLQPQQGLL